MKNQPLTLENLRKYLNSLSTEQLDEIREKYHSEWGIDPETIQSGEDVYEIAKDFDYDLSAGAEDGLNLEEYIFWWR